jgi:hypothetical protein
MNAALFQAQSQGLMPLQKCRMQLAQWKKSWASEWTWKLREQNECKEVGTCRAACEAASIGMEMR